MNKQPDPALCQKANDDQEIKGNSEASLSGEVFAGRYKIVEQIGMGGMSDVYKAEDMALRRIVALKLLLPRMQFAQRSLIRFQQEGQAMSKLNHASIVEVYDLGIHENVRPYIVMEYVTGKPLSFLIEQKTALSVDETVDIILDICGGLEHAHNHRIIHRDLKPSNIMMVPAESGAQRVKIVDFGMAKVIADESAQLTSTGEVFGSPCYMSPEQCLGAHVDRRSDIYSLGCLMYECLAGMPPHVGESPLQTLFKHRSDTALTLREATMGAEFPKEIERIVARMLAKRPQDRYQCIEELHFDLENFKLGEAKSNPWSTGDRKGIEFFHDLSAANLHQLQKIKVGVFHNSSGFQAKSLALMFCAILIIALAYMTHEMLVPPPREASPARQVKDNKASIKAFNSSEFLKRAEEQEHRSVQDVLSSQGFDSHWLDCDTVRARATTGWSFLSKYSKLRYITAIDADVSDSDLAYLKAPSLKSINLEGCPIKGTGLSYIQHLPNLQYLGLKGTYISDDNLRLLNDNLVAVDLSSCTITDRAVPFLVRLPHLRRLNLAHTQITDNGLAALEQVKRLEFLRTWGSKVTGKATAEFDDALPNCLVNDQSAVR